MLTVRELSADGTKATGSPRIVFDGGEQNHTTEGPKLYKRNGRYWIMCPAGGVKQGWQLAMRSNNIYGPYEARKVMAQGSTNVNGPHQGVVHTAQGEDWFLHFNDKGAYGRVVVSATGRLAERFARHGQRQGRRRMLVQPYLTYRMPKVCTALDGESAGVG